MDHRARSLVTTVATPAFLKLWSSGSALVVINGNIKLMES
jgi:hypothetical protein